MSATLQGSIVSASEGQSLISEESFNLFWKRTQQQRQQLGVAEPNLPKQRKVPRRYEVRSSISELQTSVEAFYRKTYYEVIDYVVQVIRSRFDQNGYKILCRLEELLCDAKANLEDFDDILSLYGNDLSSGDTIMCSTSQYPKRN